MTKQEIDFLYICKCAITNTIPDISDIKECEVLYNASEADLIPMIYPISSGFTNDNWKKEIAKKAKDNARKVYKLFYITRNVSYVLKKENIQSCVLKGIDTASFYFEPEYRSFNDVDILVKPEDFELASSILEKNGYKKKTVQYANHHVVFSYKNGLELELHKEINRAFSNQKVNEIINDVISLDKEITVNKEVFGCDFTVLEPEYMAFGMMVHMLEHYLNAGFGIRLLCDWVLFWNKTYDEKIYKKYYKLCNDISIGFFSDIITNICIRYLGLKNFDVTFHNEKVEDELLSEILSSGRLGENDDSRIVNSMDSGLRSMFLVFHHQAKENYKLLSKVVLLYPVCWILTFAKFVKNNRKERNTNTIAVIKNTNKRGKLTKKLHLWESM